MRKTLLLSAVVLLLCSAALAEEAQMHFQREAIGLKSYPAAPRIAQRTVAPAVTLAPAADVMPEAIEAVRQWNAEHRLPTKNGFVRSLGDSIFVKVGGMALKSASAGHGILTETSRGIAYGTSFHVSGAARLRLRIEKAELPSGTILWVYGKSGEATAFDATLLDDQRSLWTPSVNGDTVYLEIEVPKSAAAGASFEVNEVLELLYARGPKLPQTVNDQPTCLPGQNSNCIASSEFPAIQAVRASIGQMEFVSGGSGVVCSGTLINDRQSSGTPYFLTANHCISVQSEASSLETYFDFEWTTCNWEDIDYLDPITGSTLLVTNANSDVTLLRLSSLPGGRVFLGWSSSAVANGTQLHRVSHPVPDGFGAAFPQMYSRTIVKTTGSACSGSPRPRFLYSNETNGGEGGVYGGSSGSAAILSTGATDARIVGQLYGSCGPDPAAGCDRRNDTVDGAFSTSFNVLRQYLDSTAQQPQPCVPGADTICLVNNRFAVRVTYDVGEGPRSMTAIKYTGDSGLFWFADAANIEVLLKMINACSFNQRFWVYVGGTTDVGVGITVTDTQTGTVKPYNNPRGTKFLTITDSSAFATCP